MWRMYIIYGKRFKVIIPTIILAITYTGMTARVRADPPLTHVHSSDWYLHTRRHRNCSPWYRHIPSVENYDHGIFGPDDGYQFYPHRQVFYDSHGHITTCSHAISCDCIAAFLCWESSERFEAARANHIHTHRELRSVYFKYRRCTRGLPERFLWAICGCGCDYPGNCKHPLCLVSAIRLPLTHTFDLGHFLLAHSASDSVPCHCYAWPPKSLIGPVCCSVASNERSLRWRRKSQLYSNGSPRIQRGQLITRAR
jgi:hypothetical protein